jgi:16S rRNA (adenine1518-N6/adenine1519-N6)-dimethyltransferase
MLQIRAKAEYVSHVPKSAFYPAPKVDSAIATIHPIHGHTPSNDSVLEDLVRALFTQRRRKLRGVLSRYVTANYGGKGDEILAKVDYDDKRVYELTPADFIRLSDTIADAIAK